jgi:hypothetical protein
VVILDEAAAWQLFGSFDVASKFVNIGGNIFEIYGVIDEPDDDFTKEVYGDKPRAFISLASADSVISPQIPNSSASANGASLKAINIIEYVLPNPVKSTAEGILKDVYAITETTVDIELKTNTDRFGAFKIIPKIPKIDTLGVRGKPLVYPFYENAAIIAETDVTLVFAGILFFALIPFATVIILIRRLIKKRKELFKKAVSGVENIARNVKKPNSIKQNRRKRFEKP